MIAISSGGVMKGAKMEKLRDRIREFNRQRDWQQFHSPKNLAMALSVETAELTEHFQWLTEEESRSLPEEKIVALREEVGDVLIYLVNLADKLGINPLQAAMDKLAINEVKYPVDKAKARAVKYTDL